VLEVRTGFLGLGEHLYPPLGAVQHVTEGRVRLRQTRRALEAEHPDWHEKPPDPGVRPDEAAPGRWMEPRDIDLGRLFWLVSEAVIAADVRTARIRLWNPGAEAVFGYTAEEIVGQPIELLVPARLLPRHRAGFGRYRATGHGAIVDAGAPVELPALRKDGREITIELSLNAVGGAADERFVLAVVRDVSERKRAEEERVRLAAEQAARQLAQEQAAAYATLNTALRELAEDREAALRARDEFLSAAAHDLKTPLATVRAGAQLLRRLVARPATIRRAQHLASRENVTVRGAIASSEVVSPTRASWCTRRLGVTGRSRWGWSGALRQRS
jgi:PAS domain S-box-containing protein